MTYSKAVSAISECPQELYPVPVDDECEEDVQRNRQRVRYDTKYDQHLLFEFVASPCPGDDADEDHDEKYDDSPEAEFCGEVDPTDRRILHDEECEEADCY